MGLSNKQRVFINEYLQCWNATEAARRAGYAEKYLNTNATKLLQNTTIQDKIQARLQAVHMSADEALSLLADMARGDLGEFMDISSVGFNLDLLDEDGNKKNTRLIRKIKQKTTTFIAKKESDEDREVTETEIELYDAQAAIDKILRVAGKYKDVGSSGNPLTIDNQNGITNEGFDRAISSLAEAISGTINKNARDDKASGQTDET